MTWLFVGSASVAGFALGWAAARYRFRKREATARLKCQAHRDLMMQVGRPLDFALASSNCWEAVS
jgi:hypothetical protein